MSPALVDASALRPERVRGVDLLIVRELGGGIYYGTPRGEEPGRAVNTMVYREEEVRRVARLAFDLARGRRQHVVSVDKANVLEVSRLWRAVVNDAAAEAPDVELEHMLVDRAAMELVGAPARFDVLLTGNLFGDILSDEAGALAGSLGVLPSASLGGTTDLYEPVHGSAPTLEGTDSANPAGAILSMAMMCRHTLGLPDVADAMERAVEVAWSDGLRTPDVADPSAPGATVGTQTFTDGVVARLGTVQAPAEEAHVG